MKKGFRFLTCVAVLALALAVSACGGNNNEGGESPSPSPSGPAATQTPQPPSGDPDPGPVTPGISGPDLTGIQGTEIFVYHQSFGPRLEQDARDFEALHNVRIRMEATPWDQYYSRLMSLIMADDSPDIFDSNDEVLPMYALREVAQPIDGLFTPNAPWLDFEVMNGMQYHGKTYILQEIGRVPHLIYYNVTMFNRYGLPTPMELYRNGEWTVQRMFDLSREFVGEVHGSGEIDQFGFVATSVYMLFGANQLPIASYDPIAGKFELNVGDERQLAVLQEALDRVAARDIEPFGWTAADLFPRGRLAMTGHEHWFANSLGTMEDEWSVAPFPTGQFGDPNYNHIRPWGASVATGAKNPLGGIAFTEFQYARNLEQDALFVDPWVGERGENLRIARDKKSFFSLHNGIPNFRTLADQITWDLNAAGGRTAADIVNEGRSALQQTINDFNDMIEGWVDPKVFVNPGPVDFEDGTKGYLTMPIEEGNITHTIVDDGIDGRSLHIELVEAGWWHVFGTGYNDLEIVGANSYRVTFDFEIIRTDAGNVQFSTQINPGAEGWTEMHVAEGDRGTFDMVVAANTDNPDIWLALWAVGALELMIDNFNIEVVE